ncbi:hypothetical protein [Pandoraea commovens]|uniref:Uncharacterized protein n=1 Tax=Pandoraea commovens TaxID=2508289 RepID=A0A5E4TBN2_9BURK|nr:hypothetical protein [Pandoraea commovens]UVA79326.1 hypothetical protein NTU39_25610 [Pandoraea commovens]VVD85335.1 hypothetical protein PCO31010_01342 [Pandoraea commovens]
MSQMSATPQEPNALNATEATSSSPLPETHDPDALLAQYERACGEIQMAGRKLARQTLDYQTVLDEIERMEKAGTPQATDKLARLDALLDSEAFQREAREIERMAVALAGVIERLNAEVPATDAEAGRVPARSRAMHRTCA